MKERTSVRESIVALANRMGRDRFVSTCVDLLRGAPREKYVEELRFLTGHAWLPGDAIFDDASWPDYWVRTWGARGLLYAWEDSASSAIVAGLADEHYRPVEMCLKVATRYEVEGAGTGAALLARHELPRVRAQAVRCLGVTGDSEHFACLLAALDDVNADARHQAERALGALSRRLDSVT